MTNLKDDISRLRQIATDAAGPHGDREWKFECFGAEDYPQRVYVDGPAAIICDVCQGGGNPTIARHIACFDPPTIHGLLDEIEELQDECARLSEENDELPGMWEEADLIGGATDCVPSVDREPQPGDGPEYHAEHAAWERRQKCPHGYQFGHWAVDLAFNDEYWCS